MRKTRIYMDALRRSRKGYLAGFTRINTVFKNYISVSSVFSVAFISLLLLVVSGCQISEKVPEKYSGSLPKESIFVPSKISFNQLTEFSKPWQITAYIDVSDQFNSRLKAPGIWRFELYSKVQRSADPKGGRIKIWQDWDLTDARENNLLWQDYLRCYKFELNLDSELSGEYVLEAVCFTAEGKRLSDRVELKR